MALVDLWHVSPPTAIGYYSVSHDPISVRCLNYQTLFRFKQCRQWALHRIFEAQSIRGLFQFWCVEWPARGFVITKREMPIKMNECFGYQLIHTVKNKTKLMKQKSNGSACRSVFISVRLRSLELLMIEQLVWWNARVWLLYIWYAGGIGIDTSSNRNAWLSVHFFGTFFRIFIIFNSRILLWIGNDVVTLCGHGYAQHVHCTVCIDYVLNRHLFVGQFRLIFYSRNHLFVGARFDWWLRKCQIKNRTTTTIRVNY